MKEGNQRLQHVVRKSRTFDSSVDPFDCLGARVTPSPLVVSGVQTTEGNVLQVSLHFVTVRFNRIDDSPLCQLFERRVVGPPVLGAVPDVDLRFSFMCHEQKNGRAFLKF